MKKQPWIFPCGKLPRELKVQVASSYPSTELFLFVKEMDVVDISNYVKIVTNFFLASWSNLFSRSYELEKLLK